jgi:hypothetical protein
MKKIYQNHGNKYRMYQSLTLYVNVRKKSNRKIKCESKKEQKCNAKIGAAEKCFPTSLIRINIKIVVCTIREAFNLAANV